MFYPELLIVAAFVAVVWVITRPLPAARRLSIGVLTALGVIAFLALLGAYTYAALVATGVTVRLLLLLARPARAERVSDTPTRAL